MSELDRLKQAIEHLESQREVLGDEVVEAALIPLQEKLAELEFQADFPELQRKQVTILYADIVDSTKIASHLDPEDTRDIIDGALQRLSLPIEQHNGNITRYTGDGFKAVFGSPKAHENDPEQAVRAGLNILEVARTLSSELAEERGIENLQVRVGINTGLVAVGGMTEAEDTIMGSPVNLAKRIESAAPPGEVLISNETYRHVQGIFDVQPSKPIIAKGFDEPVDVYLVTRIKPRKLPHYTRGVEGLETRMVGRQVELTILKNAFSQATVNHQGQVINIVGEAGIGKTRLLNEFYEWAELYPYHVRLFLGRGRLEIQHQPYAMVRDMFAFRFEILDSDSSEEVVQKLETGFGEIFGTQNSGRMRAHFIGQLLGFDCSRCETLKGVVEHPQLLREQATRYLIEYIRELSDILPVVFMIEDLHWVDDSSLNLLDELSAFTPQLQLLIICVARPELFETRPKWGYEKEFHTTIILQPLSKSESIELVEEILRKLDHIPDALRELVIGNSEGNPFYIEELIKILIDSKVILKGETGWRIVPHNLAQVEVPTTLTGVLQARLDSLPSAERRVLQLAAVVGKDFWDQTIQMVAEAAGDLSEVEPPSWTLNNLHSLRKKELIFKREESVFSGSSEYSFKHVLFRDVTYQMTPKGTRSKYHGLTADWLVAATQAGSRSEEYAAVIADHYLAAGSPVYAADWYFRAGRRAKAQVAMREARDYFNRSFELIPPVDLEGRWQVLIEQDEVLGILGEHDARIKADLALIELAGKLKDDDLLAQAYYRQAFYFNAQGDYKKELAANDSAISAARRAKNRELEALILGLQVVCLTFLGRMEEAQETADLALVYARKYGDPDILAKTLGNVFTYYQLVDISQAVHLIEESIEILDQLGEHNLKATSMINLGYIYTQSGFFQRGKETFMRSLELAKQIENPRLVAYNQLNLGLTYYRLEEFDKASALLERTLTACEVIQDSLAHGSCQTYLGLTFEGKGDYKQAHTNFQEAWETLNQVGAPGFAMDARAGMARCTLEMGNLDQAKRYSDEICEYLGKEVSQGMEFPILAYLTCAEVFERARDEERRWRSIEQGKQYLLERAEKISDPEWRKIYLEEVPEHQIIESLLKKVH